MTMIAVTILLAGILMLALSVPLVLRKVPMNHLYGVRISAAFESDERWYEINAYGGRRMAAGASLIIATGVVGLVVPRAHHQTYAWLSGVVTLLAVLIPTAQIIAWSRRRSR